MSVWSYLPRFPWTKQAASDAEQPVRREKSAAFFGGLLAGSFLNPFTVLFLLCLLVVMSRPEAQAAVEKKAGDWMNHPKVRPYVDSVFAKLFPAPEKREQSD